MEIDAKHQRSKRFSSKALLLPVFWYSILLFSVFFSKAFSRILGTPELGLISYIAALPFCIALGLIFYRGKTNKLFVMLSFSILGLIIFSLLGTYSLGPLLSIASVLVFAKFYYLIYALRSTSFEDLSTPLNLVASIHLLGLFMSILFPEIFSQFNETTANQKWERLSGLQMNANFSAFLSAVLALYYLFVKKQRVLAILLMSALVLADSRTGLLLFILPALYIANIKSKLSTLVNLVAVAICIYLSLSIGQERLLSTINVVDRALDGHNYYPRIAMLFGGFRLAIENLPVGAGGGTFASTLDMSASVYSEAGVPFMLTDALVGGIHDSGIGGVLGQFGFLGLAFVLISLYVCMKRSSPNDLKAMDIMFILTLVLATSLSLTVISDFYTSLCIILIAWIVKQVRRETNINYIHQV